MKLIVPVVGIVFASGFCCCGDFMEGVEQGMKEAQEQQAGGGADEDVDVKLGDGGAEVKAGGAEVKLGGGAALGNLCGPFAELAPPAPSGFSVMTCVTSTTMGGGSTLVLTGSGDPAEICKPYKGWAEGKGFSITASGDSMGTGFLTANKGSQRLTLSCSNMTGQTLVSIVLSGG